MIGARGAVTLMMLAALALPAAAVAAPKDGKPKPGSLTQLKGKRGCVVDRGAKAKAGCATGRALDGAGAFMGSRAIAVSPEGNSVYVASSKSDAIAIFKRNRLNGTLTQGPGTVGCVAAKGAGNCAPALGLDEPNSLAISPDGRNVYATSRAGNSVTAFVRNRKTGGLRQLPPAFPGCISGIPIPGCGLGVGLLTPDVVVASPDGRNVYVGSFFGSSVASFARNPQTGMLTQLAGTAACIAAETAGCATGIGLKSIEGLAIAPNGNAVYAAAALSNAVVTLGRDPSTGALAQATDGSGCIVDAPLAGCDDGREIAGVNALAVSPDGASVYATSLLSNSVTSFDRTASTGVLAQKEGTAACLLFLRAAGCSFGRALSAPEGLTVSADGRSVYVASVKSGAISVLDRGKSGKVAQKPGTAGCLARSIPGCAHARALKGVSSVAVSPDGRHLYAAALESDAVAVFRRNR